MSISKKNLPNVLIVVPPFQVYFQKDISLIKKHFPIRVIHFRGLKRIILFIPKLLSGILWSDITLSRFADHHALLTILFSKLFRRRSIVIVGGYEVGSLHGIKYGLSRSFLFPVVVKAIFAKADKVLTVSNHLKKEAMQNINAKGNNIITVPNGFDYNLFTPSERKDNIVLSVAVCSKWEHIRLKGIDTLFKAAAYLPSVQFHIVGIHSSFQSEINSHIPPNVQLIPPCSQDELIRMYQRAKVYCQFSLREGHPKALCEAMLCECVPVGSDVPGIRSVMENIGFFVPPGNSEAAKAAIQKALVSDLGTQAREKIKKTYPVEKRENKLRDIIMTYGKFDNF